MIHTVPHMTDRPDACVIVMDVGMLQNLCSLQNGFSLDPTPSMSDASVLSADNTCEVHRLGRETEWCDPSHCSHAGCIR